MTQPSKRQDQGGVVYVLMLALRFINFFEFVKPGGELLSSSSFPCNPWGARYERC